MMKMVMVLVAVWAGVVGAQVREAVVRLADGTEQRLVPASTEPSTREAGEPATTLGVNLEGLRDYDRSFMFIDVMRTARPWGTTKTPYDAKAEVDAEGWPTGDAGTLAFTEMKNVNGVYRFSCAGQCEVAAWPATVRNVFYNERAKRTLAEIVVNQPAGKVFNLTVVLKNTAGGVRNVKLLRPGYESDEGLFTKEFLRAIEPFGAVRFMDVLRTNGSMMKAWEDRAKLTDATWTKKGGPYEIAIELANRTGKDIWITIPALAEDDFVSRLGDLFRERMKAPVNVFVEYSNEVWNGSFGQFKQNLELAKAEVAAGEKTLNDEGSEKNEYYWAWRRVAKRSIEIRKLLGAEMPSGAKWRMVLASQVGYMPPGTLLKRQLDYVVKYYGEPKQCFYAVAGAPYFSGGKEADANDPKKMVPFMGRKDLTADAICQRMLERAKVAPGDGPKGFHALAKQYGLRSFAYEGGLDMDQLDVSVDAKTAAQYDERMGEAVEMYLRNWYAGGGDTMWYYTLTSRFGRWGYWGLTDDVRDLNQPKYRAAVKVAEGMKK